MQQLSFGELSKLFDDTDRIPGGYKSDCYIATNTFIHSNSKILLVGNVSTAINLSRAYNCQFDIIDSSPKNCERFILWVERENLGKNIHVFCEDITKVDFDACYDVVILGNVLSWVKELPKAILNVVRALKNGGRLVAIPIYKTKKSDNSVIVNIEQFKKIPNKKTLEEWKQCFEPFPIVLRTYKSFIFSSFNEKHVNAYIDYIFNKSSKRDIDKFKEQYKNYIFDLCHNLANMNFTILVYSKELINDEPELFLTEDCQRE